MPVTFLVLTDQSSNNCNTICHNWDKRIGTNRIQFPTEATLKFPRSSCNSVMQLVCDKLITTELLS